MTDAGWGKGDRDIALSARRQRSKTVLRRRELLGAGRNRRNSDWRVLLAVLQVDKRELFGFAGRTNEHRAEFNFLRLGAERRRHRSRRDRRRWRRALGGSRG